MLANLFHVTQRNFHRLPLVVLYSSQWIYSMFRPWNFHGFPSMILFSSLVDFFRVSLMKTFIDFYFPMNLLHFSSVSLFHVSSKKVSWITHSGSLFIPSGFVPCFLSKNFHGFYSAMNLLHFSSASLFHVFSVKIFMDFFLSDF